MNADTDRANVELERRIRRHIPLSDAMAFRILSLSAESIRVEAPLEPNVNIHGSGFAGSIYSLSILTGWALGTHLLDLEGSDAQLVVARADIRYRRPVLGDIECRSNASAEQRRDFIEALRRGENGTLDLEIEVGAEPAAIVHGRYCAVPR